MPDPADLTATAAAARDRGRAADARGLLEACLARIAAREPVVRALRHLDPAQARAARPPPGPLHGIPLGVKDVLDTADMPTEYNSPIWAGTGRAPTRPRSPGRGRPARS